MTTTTTTEEAALQGFTQVPNVVLRNPDLSSDAKTAYMLLLRYAPHSDLRFAGNERLAELMKADLATANKAIHELEEVSLYESVSALRASIPRAKPPVVAA